MEKLQLVIGLVALLVFAFLSVDYRGSGKDIPPNIQLLLSLIFGAILARGAVSIEAAKTAKEKILGQKPETKLESKEVPNDGSTDSVVAQQSGKRE